MPVRNKMWMFVLMQTARGFLEVLLISVRHEVCETFRKAASFRNFRESLRAGNRKMFVLAPAREPDVWHAEADAKSLKVYWKVSFHKVKCEMFVKA